MNVPAGFAPIFKGWNVWAVLARNELAFDPLMLGVSPERRLRIWVEDKADAAPGANVADEWHPGKLKGEQIEIIQSAEGLEPAEERAQHKPGSTLNFDPNHSRVFVRFFNRGESGITPWPSDENFLLDTVYAPTAESPITSAPEPGTLEGAAGAAGAGVAQALKVVAVVGGVALGAWLLVSIINSSSRRAAA
jgi:hypothetical protein